MAATTATSRSERTHASPQKITTFLWYNNNAEEAINFYVSVFKNSKILYTTKYGDSGAGPKGNVMTIDFELDGQRFTALNGGPNLFEEGDQAQTDRVMKAVMQMKKLEIEGLKKAAEGK